MVLFIGSGVGARASCGRTLGSGTEEIAAFRTIAKGAGRRSGSGIEPLRDATAGITSWIESLESDEGIGVADGVATAIVAAPRNSGRLADVSGETMLRSAGAIVLFFWPAVSEAVAEVMATDEATATAGADTTTSFFFPVLPSMMVIVVELVGSADAA